MSTNPVIIKNVFSDIPMFFTKNSFTNDLNVKKDLTSIRESVKNVILTNIAERGFDYKFGGNIYTLMFENIDQVELYGFKFQLANMVKMYEPRVNINQIDITFGTTDINMIIEYSIAALNTKDKITIKLERSR